MDQVIVGVRLEQWAAWQCRHLCDGGTGWQGISPLGRMIEQGPGASVRGSATPVLDTGMPPDIRETHAAVMALPPALREVLRGRWNLLRREPDGARVRIRDERGRERRPVPYRMLAVVLGIQRATLCDRVQMAMEDVGVALDIAAAHGGRRSCVAPDGGRDLTRAGQNG